MERNYEHRRWSAPEKRSAVLLVAGQEQTPLGRRERQSEIQG